MHVTTRAAFAGSLAVTLSIFSAAPVRADSVSILSLQSGQSRVLSVAGLTRVAVGDGRIAGVLPIGTTQIVVNAKAPGHTTVLIWAGGQRSIYEVTVTDQTVDDIAQVLRTAINEPDVSVISVNRNVILRGTVPDTERFNRLNDLLSRFSGAKKNGDEGKLVNAVTVAQPLGQLQRRLSEIPGASNLRVDPDTKGDLIVSGTVQNRSEAEQVLGRAKGLAGGYLASDGKIIDRLEVETTSQVDVKVYVLEVDKTAQSQLGLRLQGGQITPNGIVYGNPSFIANEGSGSSNVDSGRALTVDPRFYRTTILAPTLDLLMTQGHARILSSPNLVTLPGQEATFLVGGEIPIPYSTGLGQVSIIYKDYGVKLNITPTLLGNGGVETKVAPEVSDLDFQDGVNISGFTIPALKTSKLATDVITQDGESIVMGGLLRRVESRNIQKIPLLGDIPILGQLFRSTLYQKSDSDVVFVMTPTIITR